MKLLITISADMVLTKFSNKNKYIYKSTTPNETKELITVFE